MALAAAPRERRSGHRGDGMKFERPAPSEYPDFFSRYVARVPEADVLSVLEAQPAQVRAALAAFAGDRSTHRYAPGKWSVRQVVGHFTDAERVFGYRAMRFARGDATPLPGFEENDFAEKAGHEDRELDSLLDEFESLRRSHVLMLRGLKDEAWERVGNAAGRPVSLRAQAFIMAGHVRHHLSVIETRYAAPAAADASSR
jgi:hypothetical protein